MNLRQELKANPRLYQQMNLLYMPLLDLRAHLNEELKDNPCLEPVEEEDTQVSLEEIRACHLYTSPSPRDQRRSRKPCSG